MTEPLPSVTIGQLSVPLADADAAVRAAEAMRGEVDRLWQADRAAGLAWRDTLESVSLDGRAGETPETLGLRLAGAIRARLVKEALG
jgi:hypothetical protein